jgi:hypothetical protein
VLTLVPPASVGTLWGHPWVTVLRVSLPLSGVLTAEAPVLAALAQAEAADKELGRARSVAKDQQLRAG